MTALTIVQNACTELGIASPTSCFASTDRVIVQMRNLMNREGELLRDSYPWTRLVTEKTFSTAAQAIQTSAVPADFGWFLNDSMWNRTTGRQIAGPISPSDWQREQVYPSIAAPEASFMFRGGDILITPSPTASQTVAYEYVSKNWAEASGGTDLSRMTADTDVAFLSESLITLGIIWRWRKSKGLDYAEDFRTYEIEKAKAIARDGGSKTYNLAGRMVRAPAGNIPESGFG